VPVSRSTIFLNSLKSHELVVSPSAFVVSDNFKFGQPQVSGHPGLSWSDRPSPPAAGRRAAGCLPWLNKQLHFLALLPRFPPRDQTCALWSNSPVFLPRACLLFPANLLCLVPSLRRQPGASAANGLELSLNPPPSPSFPPSHPCISLPLQLPPSQRNLAACPASFTLDPIPHLSLVAGARKLWPSKATSHSSDPQHQQVRQSNPPVPLLT